MEQNKMGFRQIWKAAYASSFFLLPRYSYRGGNTTMSVSATKIDGQPATDYGSWTTYMSVGVWPSSHSCTYSHFLSSLILFWIDPKLVYLFRWCDFFAFTKNAAYGGGGSGLTEVEPWNAVITTVTANNYTISGNPNRRLPGGNLSEGLVSCGNKPFFLFATLICLVSPFSLSSIPPNNQIKGHWYRHGVPSSEPKREILYRKNQCIHSAEC